MKYMVTLKPVGSYFFGGEVTLGDGTTQNYFVKSNLLPQASALLGLIRYEVLRENNLLSYNPKDNNIVNKVKYLIGENGFSLKQTDANTKALGIIKSISPVFLYKPDEKCYYTIERVDRKAKMTNKPKKEDIQTLSVKREVMDNCRCSFSPGQGSVKLQSIADFNEKVYDYNTYWCDNKGNRLTLKEDVFTFTESIGITKNGRKENEKDAFFKQEMIQLNPALCMAFMAEMTDGNSLHEGESWVFLGGNRSMFKMNIQHLPDQDFDFRTYFKPLHVNGSRLALGDAYLPDETRQAYPFIWGTSIPFRHMENTVNDGHSWRKPKKSVLYNLQQRGSIIYGDEDQLDNLKHLPFQDFGLNYFV